MPGDEGRWSSLSQASPTHDITPQGGGSPRAGLPCTPRLLQTQAGAATALHLALFCAGSVTTPRARPTGTKPGTMSSALHLPNGSRVKRNSEVPSARSNTYIESREEPRA